MDWKLEVIVVPVLDVDRAKQFYSEQVGFHVDVDHQATPMMRVVQLTPPGSACSITIGNALVDSPPGSLKGLQLVVPDIEAAHLELVARGVPGEPGPTPRTAKAGPRGGAARGIPSSSSKILTETAGRAQERASGTGGPLG